MDDHDLMRFEDDGGRAVEDAAPPPEVPWEFRRVPAGLRHEYEAAVKAWAAGEIGDAEFDAVRDRVEAAAGDA